MFKLLILYVDVVGNYNDGMELLILGFYHRKVKFRCIRRSKIKCRKKYLFLADRKRFLLVADHNIRTSSGTHYS